MQPFVHSNRLQRQNTCKGTLYSPSAPLLHRHRCHTILPRSPFRCSAIAFPTDQEKREADTANVNITINDNWDTTTTNTTTTTTTTSNSQTSGNNSSLTNDIKDQGQEGNSTPTNNPPAPPEVSESEYRRRMLISTANRGKAPWNKGKKLSPELRALISRKTREAMQRPEVRERVALAHKNYPRRPIREDVRERISTSLREFHKAHKDVLEEQVDILLARLAQSPDPDERKVASYEAARLVFFGMARNTFRTRSGALTMADKGWHEHPTYKQTVMKKCFAYMSRGRLPQDQRLETKMARGTTGVGKGHGRSGSGGVGRKGGKYVTAIKYKKQLMDAEQKLQVAEQALQKLQKARPALANDPARMMTLIKMEKEAKGILYQLQDTVEKLREKMAPLQPYLNPDVSAVCDVVVGGEEVGGQEGEDDLSLPHSDDIVPGRYNHTDRNGNGNVASGGREDAPHVIVSEE